MHLQHDSYMRTQQYTGNFPAKSYSYLDKKKNHIYDCNQMRACFQMSAASSSSRNVAMANCLKWQARATPRMLPCCINIPTLALRDLALSAYFFSLGWRLRAHGLFLFLFLAHYISLHCFLFFLSRIRSRWFPCQILPLLFSLAWHAV